MTAFLITAYLPSAIKKKKKKKNISHFGNYEQVKNLLYNKAPLGKTGCLRNPYFLLTGCARIQFFDSPRRQSVRPISYLSLAMQLIDSCEKQLF